MKKFYIILITILYSFSSFATCLSADSEEEEHPYKGWAINNIPADATRTAYLAQGYFYTYHIEYLNDVEILVYENGDGNVYFYNLFPNMMSLQYDEELAAQNVVPSAPIIGKRDGDIISIPKQHFFHWYYSYEEKAYELYFSAAKVENGKVVELDDDLRFEVNPDGSIWYKLADEMRHAYYAAFDESGNCWVYNADLIMMLDPNHVESVSAKNTSAGYYDLQGRRLSSPSGFYIANGQKHIR